MELIYLVVPISNSAISNYSLFPTEFSKIFAPLTDSLFRYYNTRYFQLLKIEKNAMTIKFLEKDKKEKKNMSHFKKKSGNI